MNSICIKFIEKEKIEYIIQMIELLQLEVYISNYRFRVYDNLIIHYDEENICKKDFIDIISEVLIKVIEIYYEENIIKKIINKNYFYLSNLEKKYICEITKKVLELPDEKIGEKRKILKNKLIEYLENDKIYFEGFVNFRLYEYREIIDRIIEISVFSYLDLNSF